MGWLRGGVVAWILAPVDRPLILLLGCGVGQDATGPGFSEDSGRAENLSFSGMGWIFAPAGRYLYEDVVGLTTETGSVRGAGE
jgi:hypothetical protein